MTIPRSLFTSFRRKAFDIHFILVRSMSSYKEVIINLKGHNINYLKAGVGEKNVFLLPGALGTIWSDFKPQLEGIDKSKFTIYAWDPPGYGKSRPPDKIFGKDFYHKDAQLAADLMKELRVNKYSLVGWSDGGITALIMAAQNQENVDKLVVWGANAYVTQHDITIYEGIRDVSKWSEKMRAPLAAVYGEAGLQRMWSEWTDTLVAVLAAGGDVCRGEVARVAAPSLVVHGDRDPVVPADHPHYLATHLPHATLHHFQDGKHNLHFKYAKEFNKLVEDFILM